MISIHSFKHIVQQITDITDRPACSLLCVCVLALQPIVNDFADLKMWSGVALNIESQNAFQMPHLQTCRALETDLEEKWSNVRAPLHCEQSYAIIVALVSWLSAPLFLSNW